MVRRASPEKYFKTQYVADEPRYVEVHPSVLTQENQDWTPIIIFSGMVCFFGFALIAWLAWLKK